MMTMTNEETDSIKGRGRRDSDGEAGRTGGEDRGQSRRRRVPHGVAHFGTNGKTETSARESSKEPVRIMPFGTLAYILTLGGLQGI